MSRYSVDRIEGDFAVIESDGNFFSVSLDELPENVTEGIILTKNTDGSFLIDESETKKRKALLYDKQNALFNS